MRLYSLGEACALFAIDPVTGVRAWTPLPNQVGCRDVDIVATDTHGDVATQIAIALPMPWAAPETKATRPARAKSSLDIIDLWSLRSRGSQHH